MGKYQGYDKYKDSGVEWLGDVPEHWEVKSLRHICEFLNRRRIPLSSEHRGSMSNKIYPYYGASGIIDYVEDFIFNEPTILIAEDGANLLSRSTPLAFIADGEYWVNNHAHILKPFLGEFGYWANLLCIIKYDNWITGSAQPKLTKDNLASIKLPTPPLDEQEKIARFLDYKTKQIDELIAKKETLIEKLDEKRTSLISHAVTKGLDVNVAMKDSGIEWLGAIPQHWNIVRLKYISSGVTVGIVITPAKYYVESGVSCLRSLNIKENRIDGSNLVFISEESNEFLRKSKIYTDDLLAVRTGQPGTTAVVTNIFNGTNCIDLIIIRKNEKFISNFLCYQLNSPYCKHQFTSGTDGAIQQHFNIETACNLIILIPNLEEQQKIADYLDQKTAQIEEQKTKIQQAIDLLKEYRTALITNAVTGKIDVRKITVPKI